MVKHRGHQKHKSKSSHQRQAQNRQRVLVKEKMLLNNSDANLPLDVDSTPSKKSLPGKLLTRKERRARIQETKKKFQGLFQNPNEIQQDAALIRRATRSKWNVRRKGMIKRRLEAIVEHEEDPLAATGAARALIQMNEQDQKDDHLEVKQQTPQVGTQVNVAINNTTDVGRSRILQLAERFGASKLVIDGATISVADVTGQTLQPGGIQERPSE